MEAVTSGHPSILSDERDELRIYSPSSDSDREWVSSLAPALYNKRKSSRSPVRSDRRSRQIEALAYERDAVMGDVKDPESPKEPQGKSRTSHLVHKCKGATCKSTI